MKSKYLWTPILMAASAIAGLYIGRAITYSVTTANKTDHEPLYYQEFSSGSDNKLIRIIDMVHDRYVDHISTDTLVESIIPQVLEKLDPHSVYIPAKDFERVNDDLKSNFGGVGIMFSITDDTVNVISVVAGGPSSVLGVMPGDKIIKVDGENFVGDTLTNDLVLSTLRGEVGTEVNVTMLRDGKSIDFNIVRGIIPLNSVDVSYMLEPGIGYMRIDRFAEKTYEEMLKGIAKLKAEKCETLIVDLRGNGGGLLDVVVNMVNEFLEEGDLIVYTEGAHQQRDEARANGIGTCQKMNVAVLIDEFSASASEIFAGAIQDNDRGTVIGRRSFGKGLVQTQIPMNDGSAVRLTIARYHTPSGRCIQRPYGDGTSNYYDDYYKRYESGELFEADSVKFNTDETFQTKKGRTVFGGGGIMPDVFVPRDSTKASDYLYKLRAKGIIFRFANEYADRHRPELTAMSLDELIKHLNKLNLMSQLRSYAAAKGISTTHLSPDESDFINVEVKAYIGRNIKDNDAFYPILNSEDPVIKRAIEVIKTAN